jgi:hypothetical protein
VRGGATALNTARAAAQQLKTASTAKAAKGRDVVRRVRAAAIGREAMGSEEGTGQ